MLLVVCRIYRRMSSSSSSQDAPPAVQLLLKVSVCLSVCLSFSLKERLHAIYLITSDCIPSESSALCCEATQFAKAATKQDEVRDLLRSSRSQPRRTRSLHCALRSGEVRSEEMSGVSAAWCLTQWTGVAVQGSRVRSLDSSGTRAGFRRFDEKVQR